MPWRTGGPGSGTTRPLGGSPFVFDLRGASGDSGFDRTQVEEETAMVDPTGRDPPAAIGLPAPARSGPTPPSSLHRPAPRVLLAALVAGACSLTGPADGTEAELPVAGQSRCDRDFGDPGASPYVLPFPEGRTYRLIQGNCPPNPAWGHYGWFAYDFDLATGDTVVASRAGRVRFVREDQPDVGGRCGVNGENLVIVEHDDGSIMFYVHLTTGGALVSAADRVEQGQPIGLSGNSGCSSGPHLHVMLFGDATDTSREASRAFNYSNARGPLDGNRSLVQGGEYTAGPLAPGG